MIFDNIKNSSMYYGVHSKFKTAFDFIKRALQENLPVQRHEVDGDEVYAIIQEYDSKDRLSAKNEAHKRYIDLQFVASGREKIEVEDISASKSKEAYDESKDVEFYHDAEDACSLVLTDGDFAILFPHDVHKPGLRIGENPSRVKKIVVKIKVE